MEQVVLVDTDDADLGLHEKVGAHVGEGLLHRAFTVLVFDSSGRVLIAKRSDDKMLWPDYWDSACASHPRAGESYEAAGERRLLEELGFSCGLHLVDKFTYHVPFHDVGSEREVCATLVGFYDGEVIPNADEVAEWRWVSAQELIEELKVNEGAYAPWFVMAVERLLVARTLGVTEEGRTVVFDDLSCAGLLSRCGPLVTPVLESLLTEGVRPSFRDPMLHQIRSGGKRIRPALVVMTTMMLGGRLDDALLTGAALEIMHNATLIADDIIDSSTVRRGLPTTWMRHGRSFAECAVLHYTATVFSALARASAGEELVALCSETLRSIVQGELLDILFEHEGHEDEPFIREGRVSDITVEDYADMVCAKTASLFEACCVAGGICSGADEEQLAALGRYGRYLGMAFQVQDDFLDVFGEPDVFGKQIGRDIYERKAGNIVILNALHEMPEGQGATCREIMSKNSIGEDEVALVIDYVRRTKAGELAQRLAADFAEEAISALDSLPDNLWRGALTDLVGMMLRRQV